MSSDTDARLGEIRNELALILEARVSELMKVMRQTEQTTRQIVSTELEITRYRHMQEQLGEELSELSEEVEALNVRTREVRDQHASIRKDRDRAKEDLQQAERGVREADSEVETLRQRLATLTSEAESLQAENVDLKARIRTLEENVARMRKLKEELMSSISGLTAQMAGFTNLDGGGR